MVGRPKYWGVPALIAATLIVAATSNSYSAQTQTPLALAPIAPPSALKPDLNKPITLTLAKLQRIVAAAQAQARAQCAAEGAEPDMQDLIRQATPEK